MAEAKMGLVEWLDDLSVRFLLNLPPSELSSVPRLCFQVEEAQWYYEDFVRPLAAASGNPLPSLPLRAFCLALFQHCPLLSGFTDAQHIAAYEEFLAYKVRVPVRGAILLDESMERVLLVRGWKKGASWSFPRGKINKDEKDLNCAIREVYEETGYDIGEAGLVPESDQEVKYFDITMREQHMRMFVFRGVPLDTFFEPRTRKEIGKIDWYDLQSLPGYAKRNKHSGEGGNANKFYMVAPFMNPLKKWIAQQHRKDAAVAQTEELLESHGLTAHQEVDELDTDALETTPEPNAVLDRSEELKRLLSIGGPPSAPPSRVNQDPLASSSGNLLAMLQGGSARDGLPPQTPMEQITSFVPVPETPQPHHPRQPSLSHNQAPPQFPFSPRAFQAQQQQQQHQQQRNFSTPFPATQGQFNGGRFDPRTMPHNMHHQQHRPSMPTMMPEPYHNGSQPQFQQHGRNSQHLQHQQPAYPGAGQVYRNQDPQHTGVPIEGPQGAIAAGPSVPRASQLPPPKLNAHSMKLLDAFKSGNKPAASTSNVPQAASSHQSTLLGLFRTPSESRAPLPAQQLNQAATPIPPTAPDVQRTPSAQEGRRPSTLNEFTRTLPTSFKPKRPTPASSAAPAPSEQVQNPAFNVKADVASVPPTGAPPPSQEQSRTPEPTVSGTGIQSKEPKPQVVESTVKPAQNRQAPQPSQVHRPAERQTASRHPKKQSPTPKTAKKTNGSPAAPIVPFKILARPKPSDEVSPIASAPAANSPRLSPQPHVLRRPANDDQQPTVSHDGPAENEGEGKRDHLLSLFTKSPLSKHHTPPSPAAPTPAASTNTFEPPPNDNSQSTLLGLFQSSTQAKSHAQSSTPPPSAPQLAPSQLPTKPTTPTPAPVSIPSSQNQLLNLFKKGPPSASPDTPISPFTLGSPNPHQGASKLQVGGGGERSARGSFASSGRVTPGTPTEAKDKDFLLGFLNGVVLKEGRGKG